MHKIMYMYHLQNDIFFRIGEHKGIGLFAWDEDFWKTQHKKKNEIRNCLMVFCLCWG